MRVQFTATTAEKLDTVPKIDGQIVAVLDQLGYYYDYNGVRYQVNDGGSLVEFIQALPEGTKVGTISINETSTDLYAPTPPTKVSELSNNVGFITNVVSNLLNYYTKNDTYNKREVDSLVATMQGITFKYVEELPTTDIQTNVIYLVPKDSSVASNAKYEYINITGDSTGWELIGDTEIDLSLYVKKEELETILQDYATISDVPTKISELTNDSNFIVDADYVHTDNNFTDEDITKLDSATAVSVTQIMTSGTEIAKITINGVETPIYSSAGLLPRIIVTTEDESTVSATNGTDTVEATQIGVGQYQVDVTDYGTWTIISVYQGESAQVNVEIDAVKIYSAVISHFETTITVSFPAGSTGYFGKQGETPVAVASNPYTYTAMFADTYVASVTYNGTSYSKEIVVDQSSHTINVFCPDPQDPSLAANVLSTWLMFGNVTGTYASLAAVLNDTTALAKLASSEFAMDYMLRSTSWISSICNSTNAINAMNSNNAAAEKFICNDTWFSYLCEQTSNWQLITTINPIMTSYTTPSGKVVYDHDMTARYAYYAFSQGTARSWWNPGSFIEPHYIGYDYETTDILLTNFIMGLTAMRDEVVTAVPAMLQASVDGLTWEDVELVTPELGYIAQTRQYYLWYRYYTASKLKGYRAARLSFIQGVPVDSRYNPFGDAGNEVQVWAHRMS